MIRWIARTIYRITRLIYQTEMIKMMLIVYKSKK